MEIQMLPIGAVTPFPRNARKITDAAGTTLAAAEITGRVCCGCEVDPKYVDVEIMRWQGITNRAAVLDATGEEFDQVRGGRLVAA